MRAEEEKRRSDVAELVAKQVAEDTIRAKEEKLRMDAEDKR